jgi:hypothetical protein
LLSNVSQIIGTLKSAYGLRSLHVSFGCTNDECRTGNKTKSFFIQYIGQIGESHSLELSLLPTNSPYLQESVSGNIDLFFDTNEGKSSFNMTTPFCGTSEKPNCRVSYINFAQCSFIPSWAGAILVIFIILLILLMVWLVYHFCYRRRKVDGPLNHVLRTSRDPLVQTPPIEEEALENGR